MKLLARLFNRIIRAKPSRPEDIPKKLGSQALAKAMQEADFLRAQHGVEVKILSPDELPGLPRRVE